jgi:hypothetical protein
MPCPCCATGSATSPRSPPAAARAGAPSR